jgi:hypothetical protein
MIEGEGWEGGTGDRVHRALATTPLVHFGTLLRLLRQQHGVPLRNEALDVLALAQGNGSMALLCAALAAHGYPQEVNRYRDIEAGLCLPEDPVRFLDALAECLMLSDTEAAGLLWQFAYEILRVELGDDLAHELLPDATQPPQLSTVTWTARDGVRPQGFRFC